MLAAIAIFLFAIIILYFSFKYGWAGRLPHNAMYLDNDGVEWIVQPDGVTLLPINKKTLTKIVISGTTNELVTFPNEKVIAFAMNGYDLVWGSVSGIPIGLIQVKPLERLPAGAVYNLMNTRILWTADSAGTTLTANTGNKLGGSLRVSTLRGALDAGEASYPSKIRGNDIIVNNDLSLLLVRVQ